MVTCKIQIIEIIDDSFYPGICKAVLEEYEGQKHIFLDKPPVFGVYLDEILSLPTTGIMRVEVANDLGECVEIRTDIPDDIESEEGCHRFIVSKGLIE